MRKCLTFLCFSLWVHISSAQDWDGIPVPADPGAGNIWALQGALSDDFNYTSVPTSLIDTIEGKWTNWYHNTWTGPAPTVWQRDHVFVDNGTMKITADRPPGDSVMIDGENFAVTHLGCATSTNQVQYPVFIEANVKIMNSVLASAVWLLSSDDTQEIDICEAYGSDRWNNSFFSEERLHLSHHVFIINPFTDWQPSDAGSFYTDGSTVWREDYHRIGIFWKDPWNLEYYVDGQLVRTRSGPNEIDPVYHTNAQNPGDSTTDTRTGLSKPMDIIINTEDQTWRALDGLSPTDAELESLENNTFEVDWIRVYKPVGQPICTDGSTANGDGTFENVFINEGTALVQGQTLWIGSDLSAPPGLSIQSVGVKYVAYSPDWSMELYSSEPTYYPPNTTSDGFAGSFTVPLDAMVSDPGNNITILRYEVYFENADGELTDCRYFLFFVTMDSSPLPVVLTSFTGEATQNGNTLIWQTASELNNSHFEIERSTDGHNYNTIAVVEGNGTSTEKTDYQLIDKYPANLAYYRLGQIDFDGKKMYSPVIAIRRGLVLGQDNVRVFPSPVKEKLSIAYQTGNSENVLVSIFDISGKIVFETSFNSIEGKNVEVIDLSMFPNGSYFLKMRSPTLIGSQLFVKLK